MRARNSTPELQNGPRIAHFSVQLLIKCKAYFRIFHSKLSEAVINHFQSARVRDEQK